MKDLIKNINVFENAPEAIALLDEQGIIVGINKKVTEWLGYEPEQIKGIALRSLPFINEDSRILALRNFQKVKSGDPSKPNLLEFLTKEGKSLFGEVRSMRLNRPDGSFLVNMAWINDVTKRKETEEALIISEKKYNLLTNSASELIFTHNKAGRITFANKTAVFITGYSWDELSAMKISDLLTGENLEVNSNDFLNFEKDETELLEVICRTKAGKEIPVEISAVNFNINNGTHEVLIIARDITDRKYTELALRQSEERFRSIYENSNLGIYQTSPSGKFLLANQAFIELLGFSTFEELQNQNAADGYLDTAERSVFREIIERDGKVFGFKLKWKRPDGKIVHIRESARVVKDHNGEIVYYEGTCENITVDEQVKIDLKMHDEILKAVSFAAEKFLSTIDWKDEIKEVLEKFGKATDVSRVYIFQNSKDENGEYLTSQKFEWTNGKVSVEIDNPILHDLKYNQLGNEDFLGLLSSHKPFQSLIKDLEMPFRELMAEENILSFITMPIFVGNDFWGFIGFDECRYERVWSAKETEALKTAAETLASAISRNIFEKELINAKLDAEKSDRLKSEFLTQISHEIRTPINAILSLASLIRDEVLDIVEPEIKDTFGVLESAGSRITRTIDLILNMSEVQTDTYDYFEESFDLVKDIINEAHTELSPLASSKNLEIIVTDNSSNSIIRADKYSVSQIIVNLIDNAIKYTNSGSINIIVDENPINLKCTIKDTGIGISEEYIPDLFAAFTQEESGYTRKFEGNGLGLALVKKYCEMNKIKIDLASKKGEGTSFFLTFPKFKKIN